MNYYFAEGIVKYNGDWIILECPHTVVNYYKFWVEKFLGKKISTSYHGSHVTVLAGKHEKGLDKHPLWKKHHGKKVQFKYYSHIYTDAPWFTRGQYFWLRIECPLLVEIRRELGLRPTPYHPFHLTLGFCCY